MNKRNRELRRQESLERFGRNCETLTKRVKQKKKFIFIYMYMYANICKKKIKTLSYF